MNMQGLYAELRTVAVYLFTFHAYRSWRPDFRQGYTRRKLGVLPPDPQAAREYDRRARHAPVQFDAEAQHTIIRCVCMLSAEYHWRAHYVAVMQGHVHALISWHHGLAWNDVRVVMKRRMGRALSLACDCTGPWFTRGGRDSRKRVADHNHFAHLMCRYLPKSEHRGTHYREDCGLWQQ